MNCLSTGLGSNIQTHLQRIHSILQTFKIFKNIVTLQVIKKKKDGSELLRRLNNWK